MKAIHSHSYIPQPTPELYREGEPDLFFNCHHFAAAVARYRETNSGFTAR